MNISKYISSIKDFFAHIKSKSLQKRYFYYRKKYFHYRKKYLEVSIFKESLNDAFVNALKSSPLNPYPKNGENNDR